ncbi:hypothetical protein G3O07_11845 [Pseudomonas laurentiana]|uniref:CHASE domain-containing protein n=1 Tax=Pseudomonas laurentiana TaxID=2364649 RepID=A0A6I5RQU6_9PSED|nr:hypothetical protein [Pseudomonas laurentiana]
MPLFRLLPIGFAVVGIGLSVTLGHLDVQRQESELMGNASARLSGLRAGLEAQLRTAFGETEGIAQLISADGTITPEHFHDMARQAIASVPYIRHIAVAPADVVADVFPLEGNQRILGLDYRTLPTQYPMLQRARENHRAVLAGPIDLYQGGRGLIYRRPVFVGGLSSTPIGAISRSLPIPTACSTPRVWIKTVRLSWPCGAWTVVVKTARSFGGKPSCLASPV